MTAELSSSSLPPTSDAAPGELKRGVLGTGSIAFMVVAAAAPLTVLAGIAPLAILIGGIGAPAAYLLGGLTFVVFAVAFTRMTKHVGSVGAFYAYVTKGLGPTAGLGAAILALMSYNVLQIGGFGLLSVVVQATLADFFGVTVPWPLIAAVAIALVFLLGWAGIDIGAKVLGVLLVLEAGILLLMAFAVVFHGGGSGLNASSFSPDAVVRPGMGGALAFAFGAFLGFESTALYRGEARDPERTIPRATYIAIIGMALSYAFVVWAVVQAFGTDQAVAAARKNTAGMFFTVASHYLGAWAATVMHILIITSIFASQLAFHNASNRYAFSLAKDGVLPGWVGTTHRRFGSPYRAGLAQTGLAVLIVGGFAVAGADPYFNPDDLGQHARGDRHLRVDGDHRRGVRRVLPPAKPRGEHPDHDRRWGGECGAPCRRNLRDRRQHRVGHRCFTAGERHPDRPHPRDRHRGTRAGAVAAA